MPGAGRNHEEPEAWKATRLVDERTGNSLIGIDFPRRQRGPGFEVLDDDLAEQPKRVRVFLKRRGAAFAGTKKEQIQFVLRLLRNVPPKPLTLAMKSGLRGRDGFVLGTRMLGTAKGAYRSKSDVAMGERGQIGDDCGSKANWDRDAGEVALKSSALTFGVCLALACPLPNYVEANAQERLLSETAVFNLSGESGSGKTSVVRAAAGVFGPPGRLRKWDFSRRGLEEYCESCNDLLVVTDDLETHTEEAGSLKTAMRHVNQVIPSGQSKLLSKRADLEQLLWSAFGLTSSPESIDEIAERIGWKRTDGERARFIDIAVPKVDQAGIFDRLDGDALENIGKGKDLIKQLDAGVTQNFGLIMPLWLKFLFQEDRSTRILKLRDKFLHRVTGNGDGFDERYAVQFAVPAAAGYLAAKAGVVPWTPI
jgi:Domain of unknown function (DUF927)